MPLQQSTPPSRRRRWQGTRTSFVDLVKSLQNCMGTVGYEHTTLKVEIGNHEGELASSDDLRHELTEALWLGSDRITVAMTSTVNAGPGQGWPGLVMVLSPGEPVLGVSYYGGTPQLRETLRVVVERTLPPEHPDPRRRWRWLGPIVGCAYAATFLLIISRLPRLSHHPILHVSGAITDAIGVVGFALNVAFGTYFTWLAFQLWFPPRERLPDSARSHWDRRRGWFQVGVGLWVTLVLGVLALPVAK